MKLNDFTYNLHKGVNDHALLLLHGVGGDENDMTQIGQLIDPDASRISPKGKISVGGYARYFTRLADASFDPKEVAEETDDLSRFVVAVNKQHDISIDNLMAIGYSNGANMIASLLAKHPLLIKKAILFRGMLPINFSEHPNLNDVDILLVNGEGDTIMDRDRVEQLRTFLVEHGANVSLQWTTAGHQITSEDIVVAKQWLATHSD